MRSKSILGILAILMVLVGFSIISITYRYGEWKRTSTPIHTGTYTLTRTASTTPSITSTTTSTRTDTPTITPTETSTPTQTASLIPATSTLETGDNHNANPMAIALCGNESIPNMDGCLP